LLCFTAVTEELWTEFAKNHCNFDTKLYKFFLIYKIFVLKCLPTITYNESRARMLNLLKACLWRVGDVLV
jgi:hypothetical protein